MIKELWGSFPRLIERNINGLLETAFPRPVTAFHLYKACLRDDVWDGTFKSFSTHLEEFFSRPRAQRKKSQIDRYLKRPIDQKTFNSFSLDFRTGLVSDRDVSEVASWAHHLIRVSRKTLSEVISIDVLTKTLRTITEPMPHEKATDIEFDDFCSAWKKTVFKIFGRKHEAEFNAILSELHLINIELKEVEERRSPGMSFPTIYLTQTEVDWVLAVKEAAAKLKRTPKFPLSRGPQKQALIELERVASLYNIVQVTDVPKLVEHREKIRATLFFRCDRLVWIEEEVA